MATISRTTLPITTIDKTIHSFMDNILLMAHSTQHHFIIHKHKVFLRVESVHSLHPSHPNFSQGYRSNPQYQYGGQNYPGGYPGFSPEENQPPPSDSTSPPTYAPYAPYSPNGTPPNYPYYNNNNYYNTYYYPYSGGGYPYGYNQNFNPAHPEGDEAGAVLPTEQSAHAHIDPTQPQPDHVNTTPSTTETTPTPTASTHPDSTPEPTPSTSTLTTPTTTNDMPTSSEPQPIPQRSIPRTYSNSSTGSPRSQGGPRSSPKSQQPKQSQPKQQKQAKTHRPPPPQDAALHSHVIPSFSKLSVSSN
jgi:hypothetical protein